MKLTTPAQLHALGATTQEIQAYGDECHKFVKDLKAQKGTGDNGDDPKKNKK